MPCCIGATGFRSSCAGTKSRRWAGPWEVSRGPDGAIHTLAQPAAGGPVVIHPWPLWAPEIEVAVEASVLTQLQFRDDAALAARRANRGAAPAFARRLIQGGGMGKEEVRKPVRLSLPKHRYRVSK